MPHFSKGQILAGDYTAGHWMDDSGDAPFFNVMNPVLQKGKSLLLSDADETAMDVIGWDLTNEGSCGAGEGSCVGTAPIPAAIWLFGSGLLGLIGVARCKKS